MRWKRALWAASLAPVMGGCLTVYQPHGDHIAEHAVAKSERDISRQIHGKARNAWQMVRCEFPRKVFTPEFRDGFIDGYSDYLDRGGDGQPPAAPPLRYTQNKKYYTPEGHALMRDYLLGFQYGTEVAIATGQRQYLTVPVLIPDTQVIESHAIPVAPAIPGSDAPAKPLPPPPMPLPAPKPMTKLPAPRPLGKEPPPRAVVAPSTIGDGPEVTKFGTIPPRPDPVRNLVPPIPEHGDPLVPLPESPLIRPIPMVPMGKADSPNGVVPAAFKLPTPPSEVLDLPDDVPTPPVLLDLSELPVLPVNHPEPAKK